ncbi:MAG TPA: hypothetical protein VFE67_15920 [Rudaea sp.]|nr:hypothetical protein [Rudaea sp.]
MTDLRTRFGRSIALIAASLLAGAAHAQQDGAYDPGFGNVGRAWIDVTPSTQDRGATLIRLPNGNFFMGGACGLVACAAWLTPSGALAAGYGTSGTGSASFSAFSGWPTDENGIYDAAAFSDGRVAVALNRATTGVGYVAVLRADGTALDPEVGNGFGYVSPSFVVRLLRITPQQKVIVVGRNTASPFALVFARYDSTMHLDTSFGTSGTTTIGFSAGNTFPQGMRLQKDGKIVVIATVGVTATSTRALGIVRLTVDGDPDPDFGINSDGRFLSAFGNTTGGVQGTDIAVDKQGRLVIVGESETDIGDGEWFVDRLLGGGATDPSFNGGQPHKYTVFVSSTNYEPAPCCVGLQNDGRILVAGTMDRADLYDKYFAMSRFTDDGNFDYSFGIEGQSYGDMTYEANATGDSPEAMVIVPGGAVIAGATAVNNSENRFSATKVMLDPLFASDFE